MSLNHYYSTDLPEALWWTQQKQPIMDRNNQNNTPNSSWPSNLYHQYHQASFLNPSMFPIHNSNLNFNLNNNEDEDENEPEELQLHQQDGLEKEPMFEKPLTPSDVGKLNRLVIPKQHAEKYFPLGGGDSGSDKGLLLSFEDESGKRWNFRYSYWNSSQSYVLTKGWSRYVKEKQLDAGDVILFERHRSDSDRLFIGWRRRGEGGVQGSNSGVWSRGLYGSSTSSSAGQPYPTNTNTSSSVQHGHGGADVLVTTCVPYQSDCLHAGSVAQNHPMPLGNPKRLRLFGVNLECQLDESEPSTPDDGSSSVSSQGPAYPQFYSQSAYSSNSHNRMDITFSQDVNQMRNRRG